MARAPAWLDAVARTVGVVLLPKCGCYSRLVGPTLFDMGEHDWLERGHGGGEGLQPMIKGSALRVSERASIRSVLRGSEASTPRRATRRRTKALVGWLLYCCTAVGGTAAAFTVRDTLFPSLGAPATRSLWVSTNAGTTGATDPASTSSSKLDTTVVASTEVAETVATTQPTIADQSVDSSSSGPGGGNTTNSIDDRGNGNGSGGNVPETGTTVAGPSSSGTGNGGTVTTIDDHATDTSTAASATPASVDPTPTQATAPASDTTDTSPGHQSGKNGGGGGGGSSSVPPAP